MLRLRSSVLVALCSVAGLLTVSGARPAAAESRSLEVSPEAMQAARRHYASGNAAYQRGEYDLARREFEQAYSQLPLPEFLQSLSQAAEKQGKLDDAIRYAEAYVSGNPDGGEVGAMTTRLNELRARKQAALVVPAAAPKASAAPSLVPPLALAGSGLALLIVGGGLGLKVLSNAGVLTDPQNSGKPFTTELMQIQEESKRLNIAAITLDVIGGVVLVGGAGWLGYTIHQRRKQGAGSEMTRQAQQTMRQVNGVVRLSGY